MERRGDGGFTLIELVIALALFALIAVAGVALVDSVLGVQGRTAARLDRLSALQRAMLVVSGDIEQVARDDVVGGGAELGFTRAAPGIGGSPLAVRYTVRGGVLMRIAGGTPQRLLPGVSGARWRFYGDGWVDRWPVSQERRAPWPRAIELELTLAGSAAGGEGDGQALRRVVLLPVRAKEPA